MQSVLAEDVNLIAAFLASPDLPDLSRETVTAKIGRPADVGIVMVSSVLFAADVVAKGMKEGSAKNWMIVGGIGHSTNWVRDAVRSSPRFSNIAVDKRAEADIFEDVLLSLGVEVELEIENQSTNCGANATYAAQLLEKLGIYPREAILVQDPTMMLRMKASFRHVWPDKRPKLFNCPTFVPRVHAVPGSPRGIALEAPATWPLERFLSLLLGEIPRLRNDANGYGPLGANYIPAVEIPHEVEQAYARLALEYSDLLR